MVINLLQIFRAYQVFFNGLCLEKLIILCLSIHFICTGEFLDSKEIESILKATSRNDVPIVSFLNVTFA